MSPGMSRNGRILAEAEAPHDQSAPMPPNPANRNHDVLDLDTGSECESAPRLHCLQQVQDTVIQQQGQGAEVGRSGPETEVGINAENPGNANRRRVLVRTLSKCSARRGMSKASAKKLLFWPAQCLAEPHPCLQPGKYSLHKQISSLPRR